MTSLGGLTVRDIVNERDEIVGQATKDEIAAQRLICRVAMVMLVNGNGELLLQQRAVTKKTYPLYWSSAAVGHVESGETYEEAAKRELMEEIGVDTPLEFVEKFYSDVERTMVGVFMGFYDGLVRIDPHEVARVALFTPASLTKERVNMMITSFVDRSLPMVLDRISAMRREYI